MTPIDEATPRLHRSRTRKRGPSPERSTSAFRWDLAANIAAQPTHEIQRWTKISSGFRPTWLRSNRSPAPHCTHARARKTTPRGASASSSSSTASPPSAWCSSSSAITLTGNWAQPVVLTAQEVERGEELRLRAAPVIDRPVHATSLGFSGRRPVHATGDQRDSMITSLTQQLPDPLSGSGSCVMGAHCARAKSISSTESSRSRILRNASTDTSCSARPRAPRADAWSRSTTPPSKNCAATERVKKRKPPSPGSSRAGSSSPTDVVSRSTRPQPASRMPRNRASRALTAVRAP